MTAAIQLDNQTENSEQLSASIIEIIQESKAKEIIQLDLRKIPESPADFFIICSGESTTQIKAIGDRIKREVQELYDLLPSRIEGTDSSKWILVDFFDVVVHIFYPETRKYYELEELWGDAIIKEYDED